MTNIQTTAIIRDRGQLTIPDKIRNILAWTEVNAVVTIGTNPAREIIIKPYTQNPTTDWDKLWKDLRRVRSYKGKNTKSLSELIIEDRELH